MKNSQRYKRCKNEAMTWGSFVMGGIRIPLPMCAAHYYIVTGQIRV